MRDPMMTDWEPLEIRYFRSVTVSIKEGDTTSAVADGRVEGYVDGTLTVESVHSP